MINRDNTDPDQTAATIAQSAAAALAETGNPMARRDADLMLAHVLSIEPVSLPLFSEAVSNTQQANFQEMVDRRLAGEPVAYIVGEQGFWSLDFYVDENTLIPRPDTELLVEAGLKSIGDLEAPSVADLGCGSGCILLSILSDHAGASGVGADFSAGALSVAQRNASRHGLDRRASFIESDWFDSFGSCADFDLIVSNPPYIPAAEIAHLMRDVRDYEPISALEGGADGLDCYRRISRDALGFLAESGCLAFEVGIHQSSSVCSILGELGYREVKVFPDLAGINRVVIGKKPQES